MKSRPPLFFGLEVDKIFRIEEAGGVGPVVRTAGLAGALGDFGPRAKNEPRLIHQPDAFGRSGAGSKRPAYPQGAFIQMWQKFGADYASQPKIESNSQAGNSSSDCEESQLNGDFQGLAIDNSEPVHHRVVPLPRALREKHAGECGCDEQGKDDGAQQSERYGPGHG